MPISIKKVGEKKKLDLRLVDLSQRDVWNETYLQFGLRSLLTLASPLLNTIINWKYRNYELDIKNYD